MTLWSYAMALSVSNFTIDANGTQNAFICHLPIKCKKHTNGFESNSNSSLFAPRLLFIFFFVFTFCSDFHRVRAYELKLNWRLWISVGVVDFVAFIVVCAYVVSRIENVHCVIRMAYGMMCLVNALHHLDFTIIINKTYTFIALKAVVVVSSLIHIIPPFVKSHCAMRDFFSFFFSLFSAIKPQLQIVHSKGVQHFWAVFWGFTPFAEAI